MMEEGTPLQAENLLEHLPTELPQEVLTTILQANSFRIERIVSHGRASSPGFWYDEGGGTMGKGFFAQQYTHVGQWGTHCDPPAHFVRGKRTIDQIDVKEMVLPLVVIPKPKNGSGFPARVFAILP